MEPTAPIPLTRAAARSRTHAVDRSRDRAGVARALAMTGGAFVGAWIVLGITSLVGGPSVDPSLSPQTERVQVAVPAPRLPTVMPAPSRTPSAAPTLPPEDVELAAPVVIAPPAPAPPAPAPSQTTAPAPADAVIDSGPGKSGSAPGRNKPPKP